MTVVAAYYGGWNDPPEPIVTWRGPSPWATTPTVGNYMGNYPDRWPVYGAVNEDQQWVIDQQLRDAESAGIGVFAVNWYRDDYGTYAPDRIAASTAAPSVKWCLQWSNHYSSMSATASARSYFLEGCRRAALRMSGPRYWTRSGRPVFVVFSAVHFDDVIRTALGQPVSYVPSLAERNALIADLRAVIGNVLAGDPTGGITGLSVSASANPGPYLVLMSGDAGWASVTGVDALTAYNVRSGTFAGQARKAHSFDEMRAACRQSWVAGRTLAASSGKKHWPTAMTGFDMRAWGGDPDPLHDNCQPSDPELVAHMAEARAVAQNAAADLTVFLYAWNEFGEGGWVQPTQGVLRRRIDAVRALTA